MRCGKTDFCFGLTVDRREHGSGNSGSAVQNAPKLPRGRRCSAGAVRTAERLSPIRVGARQRAANFMRFHFLSHSGPIVRHLQPPRVTPGPCSTLIGCCCAGHLRRPVMRRGARLHGRLHPRVHFPRRGRRLSPVAWGEQEAGSLTSRLAT